MTETSGTPAPSGPSRRKRIRRRRRPPPGSAPGTLTADPDAPRPELQVIAYGPDTVEERRLKRPGKVREFLGKWPVVWINVDGLGDAKVIEELAGIFDLHRLAVEDVLNTHQRPKVEAYGKHHFIVLRMAALREHLHSEQFSLFVGEGFVLSFQEVKGDCLDPVRGRIRSGRKRIRQSGTDYLAYALIDAVVDHYFPILEQYGERIEALEDEVIAEPTEETVGRIHAVKRDLLSLRRAVWPKREVLRTLYSDPQSIFSEETRVYLRDCYDHSVQLMDTVETYRELASGLMDVYLTSISNRMNEVMKVLTIISTIFIPLSFIAGVYGMNFDSESSPFNMPELGWRYGYLYCLGLMALLAAALLYYFRRKGWLGSSGRH